MEPNTNIITLGFVYLVVSVVVSIDVIGLTLAKSEKFRAERTIDLIAWGICNGLWHAGLLWVYIETIDITIEYLIFEQFLNKIQALLLELASHFPDLNLKDTVTAIFDMFKLHIRVIVGVVAVVIVWNIYSDKIDSRPVSKERQGTSGEENNEEKLPALATIVYCMIEYVCHFILLFNRILYQTSNNEPKQPMLRPSISRIQRFLHRNFQAALVAVDMLALAIILKSLGFIGNANSKLHEQKLKSDFHEKNLQDERTIFVVLMVFFVVSSLAFLAARIGQRHYNRLLEEHPEDPNKNDPALDFIKIGLRFLEPFFIFYFVVGLLTYMIYQKFDHSVGLLFGSALFVIALTARKNYTKIVSSSIESDSRALVEERLLRRFWTITLELSLQIAKILAFVFIGLIIFGVLLIIVWISDLHFIKMFLPGPIRSLDSLVLFAVVFFLVIFVPMSDVYCHFSLILRPVLKRFLGSVKAILVGRKTDEDDANVPSLFPNLDEYGEDRKGTVAPPSQRVFEFIFENTTPMLLSGLALIIALLVPAYNDLLKGEQFTDFLPSQFHAFQLSIILILTSTFISFSRIVYVPHVTDRAAASRVYFVLLSIVLTIISVASELALAEFMDKYARTLP